MKLNLSFLLLLLPLTVVFTSCKKDKDNPKSYFTYEGKTYEIKTAQHVADGDFSSTMFTSIDATSAGQSGKVSMISFLFAKPELAAGTYTYKDDSDPAFDDTKNFFAASAFIDIAYQNGSMDETSGTTLEQLTSGSITVAKDGSSFNISYELNFNGKAVSGKYSGAIQSN